jgi:hypothetical protein
VLKNTNPNPPTPYTLPIASDETLGGVKVGNGLSIGDDGTLSTSGGGGGTSLYYKTITGDQLTASTVTKRRTIKDSNNVETCFYEVSKNLINQSGYIPIACIVGDNYTGYYSNGAVMKSGNDYVVVIVTTYASTAYNEFAPLTVIYVPETGLTELT